MMRSWLLVGLMLLLAVPLFAQDSLPDQLSDVRKLYNQGLLDEAELVALRYISRPGDLADVDRAELHRYLAYISIARGDREAGKDQFITALQLNPRLRVDPQLTSPKILAVFNQAREEYETLGKQRFRTANEMATAYMMRTEGTKRSLLFPGLGQLYKGQTVRGWTYVGVTGALIVGLGVSQVEVNRLNDEYESSRDVEALPGIYDDYRRAWRIRNYVGAAIGVVWAVNLLDSFFSPYAVEQKATITPQVMETGMGYQPGIAIQFRF